MLHYLPFVKMHFKISGNPQCPLPIKLIVRDGICTLKDFVTSDKKVIDKKILAGIVDDPIFALQL